LGKIIWNLRRKTMPAAKKPPMVSQKLLARTGEMDDTQLPYIMMDSLIAQFHPELAEANIAIGYNYGWKEKRDSKITLATVSLFSDFERQLHGRDIKILLNYNYWHNLATTDDNRKALLDHQLSHPRPIMDDSLGIPVKNDMGYIKYYLRDHDIEDFADVVDRWGIWLADMERSAEVMAAALEREKLAREERKSEELEEEEPDGEMPDGSTYDPREVLILSK
jgi:hypothetical protein